ncbi:DUF6541 family protein [Micrococcaceae bacterium Sec7.4]
MSWWNTLPSISVALLILFGPGGLLAYFIGARRLALVCLAPILSVGIIGVGGIAAEIVGMRWNLLPVLLTTAASSVAAWAFRRFVLRSTPTKQAPTSLRVWAGAATGLGLGALLIGRRLLDVIGRPENFAQRFDNVFHLNAIQYILQSGNASSLTLGSMAGGEGGGAIYPSAWHSIAALIAQLSGSDVVVAENVFNIVIGAVIWPAGMIFLVHQIVGPRPLALALAGVFSAGFAAFPLAIMDFGPLYPNILSYALLPTAIALVIGLCGLAAADILDRPSLWMSLAVAVPGLALSQTNGLLSLVAFALPLGLWAAAVELINLRRTPGHRRRSAVVVGITLLCLLLLALVWKILRPLATYDGWAPFTSQTGAVGEVILNAPMGRPVAWAVSILALVGLQQVIRNSTRFWIFLCWLVPVVLFVTTASAPKGQWRMLLTGGWYQDSYRLAALLPVFGIVLAAIGGLFLWDIFQAPATRLLNRRVRLVRLNTNAAAPAAAAVVFLTAAVLASQVGAMRGITAEAKRAYVMDLAAPIVDSDELALIKRLPSEVASDAVIAVNPWNGGSLAYALSGRKVTSYHMFSTEDAELRKIDQEIGTAQPGSDVCRIAGERHITYILDFGSSYLANSAAAKGFPGVVDVTSPGVEVVDTQGHARLLAVSACR